MSTVWARLCPRCNTIDLAAAWERREEADRHGLDWTCSRCGNSETWELVKVERQDTAQSV